MNRTVDVFGVSISKVTMNEATSKIKEFVKSDTFHSIYTPNPEILTESPERNAFSI